jgi:hypothetical protein
MFTFLQQLKKENSNSLEITHAVEKTILVDVEVHRNNSLGFGIFFNHEIFLT